MQGGGEVKIAVMTGFPAKRNVNVYAGHVEVYALWM
jgi:hypothetical protein